MSLLDHVKSTLADIEAEGLTKREREIAGPQRARIEVAANGRQRAMLNLCANNYLGLADNPQIIAAAKAAMDGHGFGMASVRFICGTQTLHRSLERAIAAYLGKDDAILFAACFDANGGVFEPLLGGKMRSSRTRSTTPRSSTACACARPSAIASPMAT